MKFDVKHDGLMPVANAKAEASVKSYWSIRLSKSGASVLNDPARVSTRVDTKTQAIEERDDTGHPVLNTERLTTLSGSESAVTVTVIGWP